MARFSEYAATAAGNTATPPAGAPEGQFPSSVNDTVREFMARARTYDDEHLAGKDRFATDSGTGAAYVIAPTPPIGALADGMTFRFHATNANTVTTPTLAVSGLTAKDIKKLGNDTLDIGDIVAGAVAEVLYVAGTDNFRLISLTPPAGDLNLGADLYLHARFH